MPKEQNISQDLYNLLLTRDFDPETTDRQGQATTPNEGVVFSFDYVSGSGRNYGTAVLVITDDAELLLFFGDNLGKSMEDPDKTEWFEFLQQLKQFATRHNFHTFSPQNLNQLKHTMAGMAAIREGLFEGYYGTRRQSYMGLPQQARLVIRHDRDIAEGDARYRHIESLFIETAEGERFRLGFRNLSGARAMLEHVRQGGRPYDVRGVHISEMVQEIQLLSRFNRASARRVVEGTEHLVEAARAFYSQLRRDLGHMGHARGYTAYFENWQPADITESDTLVEDLRALFIEQRIDDRIEAALPVLAKVEKHMKEVAVFENWAANLSEGTWTLPETPEQQKKLQELMAKELPLGPDATNATEQLYDLVGDDELFDILGVAAKYDPDANAWEVPGVAERLEELGVEMPGEEATADQAAADAAAAAAAQPTANAAAPVGNVAPVPATGAPTQPIAEADNISQFEQADDPLAQRTAAYQQQLLDRMGARFGLPPGSSLEQVKAAQLAYLDKNDPAAAAQARAGQPVQLAKRDPMQDPNFAQGLAAAKAGKGPLAIMLAQPDIANNQKYLDTIASSYGLPAGLTAQEIQAQADKKFARPAQPAAQPVAQPVGEVKHKGKRVQEGHADQQKKIFKKNGQPVGEVGIDRESSPGVGQYYMKHYASGTDNSGYDSREEAAEELRHLVKQGVAEGVDIGQEWMSDTELDQYVPDDLQQEWRELVGYDEAGNVHPLWANITGDYEPDASDPEHRAWMVKVANKWFTMKRIPNVRFFAVRDRDDELEWLVQIGPQAVAEATGDKPFDQMMSKIKQGTKKQAGADRRERDAASRERARAAFGPSPADKLSIRRDKGVAEAANAGPHIVYATGPRTQGTNDVDLVFKDIRTGKIVARVVGNNRHLQEFAPPSGGDGGDGGDLPDRPPTYEIRTGDMNRITYVAFGDPQQDPEHKVYKLGPAKPGAPKYYGQGLTLVSKLDWWSFLEKMIGEIMWEDDAIEAGYVDRLDNGDLVFARQQGVSEGADVFYNAGETANKKPVGKGTTVKNKITGIVGKAYSWSVVKGVPYLYVKGDDDRYQSPAKDWLVVDEQGVGESGYNPLDDERREQRRMDQERAQFKRDELEAELGGEEQRAQQIMSGTWYIVIDGQVWRRQGQPVTFPGRDAARRAGQTIKNRTPERTVTITTRIPAVEAAACNHTMEGEMCPEHGLAECGMAEGRDDPMNRNAAITGSYYESQDTDLLARIKQLALLK